MLDVLFGQKRLIKVEDKNDLKKKVIVCIKLLTNIENESVKSTLVAVGKFSKYITDREKTVLRKFIWNVKKEGYEDYQ